MKEIFEAVMDQEPKPDVVIEISDRLRSLDGRTDSGKLFGGLPGRAIPIEKAKQLSQELFRHGILIRNPDPKTRGFVLGDIPD